MIRKQTRNSKLYNIAAVLFAISGINFIVASAVGSNIAFTSVGITFEIISFMFWRRSKN